MAAHLHTHTAAITPPSKEVSRAYVSLVLALYKRVPGLLHTYLGPPSWPAVVAAESPTLEMLRTQAVAVATAVQKSDLPEKRRDRLLRQIRALLWLIRSQENEQIIFSEQVRMLLDLQPESVDDAFFQAAHDTLAAVLPGSGSLTARWAAWQAAYTIPATTALPLLAEAIVDIKEHLGRDNPLTSSPLKVVESSGEGAISYQQGMLRVPLEATLRGDRLYHLALQWGYGGRHSIHTAMAQRYAGGSGEVECAVLLNLGPDQVISQGLPRSLLPELALYDTAVSTLLHHAGLPPIDPAQLQALHMAEDALEWALANSALLLHSEGLRPRAVRRYLMAKGLLPRETADSLLAELMDPVRAVHLFAPLIGGPLLAAWLTPEKNDIATLLADPPVPSTMVFEVRFAD